MSENFLLEKDLIIIGKVLKPWGNRGLCKCDILTDFPERFLNLDKIYIVKDDYIKLINIESSRFHKSWVLLKFENINSINDAETFRNYDLCILEKDKIPLDEGDFYIYELIGLNGVTDRNTDLGKLKDVIGITSDNFILSFKKDKKEFLIPYVNEFILNIDLDKKVILIKEIDGLIDLN